MEEEKAIKVEPTIEELKLALSDADKKLKSLQDEYDALNKAFETKRDDAERFHKYWFAESERATNIDKQLEAFKEYVASSAKLLSNVFGQK